MKLQLISALSGALLLAASAMVQGQAATESYDSYGSYEASAASRSNRYSGGLGVSPAVDQAIRARLQASRPDLEIANIRASRIPDLYLVKFNQGQQIYINGEASYFILGDMYQVQDRGFTNLAEVERDKQRATLLTQEPRSDMIIFSPEGPVKGALYVFTDVDCGYCRKFHQEVPRLNELGVEVRYLAYPRSLSQQGESSPSFRKMASAWCAADKQSALSTLKSQQPIENNVCENNPVLRQFRLGTELGVSGTPSIVTTEGRLIPGYMTAERLAALVVPQQNSLPR